MRHFGSTKIAGIPEIVLDGKTGFTANVGDVDAMSEYAIKLLSDKNLLNEFKENALEQAKQFELSKILPMYESYYEEVLKNFKGNCK